MGRSICGATETSRKSVLSHGSSNIFNKPFEASTPIFSGSHITTALYSASNALKESLRMISSASRLAMSPC